MRDCVLYNSFAAAAVGVPGAFVAHGDVAILTGIWTNMLYNLARHAGCEMDKETALLVAGALIASTGTMLAGMKLANTYFGYTGVGTIPAMVIPRKTSNESKRFCVISTDIF